jgi:hypothetical protein
MAGKEYAKTHRNATTFFYFVQKSFFTKVHFFVDKTLTKNAFYAFR